MIVYTLMIEHRHGYNLSVHETDVDANLALAAYCRQEWNSEVFDKPMPTDSGQLIAAYFDAVEDEDATIDQTELLGEAASERLYGTSE